MNPALRTLKDAADFRLKAREALVSETRFLGRPGSFGAAPDLFCDLAGRLPDLVCKRHGDLSRFLRRPVTSWARHGELGSRQTLRKMGSAIPLSRK
jgi:hypothetical protein